MDTKKGMRGALFTVLMLCLSDWALPVYAANSNVRVRVERYVIQFDIWPIAVDGWRLVPTSSIYEAIGADFSGDGPARTQQLS